MEVTSTENSTNYNSNRFKHVKIMNGITVVLLEPIKNGEISFDVLDRGRVIYHKNQVEASVWLGKNYNYATDDLVRKLGIDINPTNGRFEGIVLELNSSSFAVLYSSTYHCNLILDEETAIRIPFFKVDESKRVTTNSANDGFSYKLDKVIDIINGGFADWVKHNTSIQNISKLEKESGDYPSYFKNRLTDSSLDIFHSKKKEVELSFAHATGVWNEFDGGLILEFI